MASIRSLFVLSLHLILFIGLALYNSTGFGDCVQVHLILLSYTTLPDQIELAYFNVALKAGNNRISCLNAKIEGHHINWNGRDNRLINLLAAKSDDNKRWQLATHVVDDSYEPEYLQEIINQKQNSYNALNTKLKLVWDKDLYHKDIQGGRDPYANKDNIITLGDFLDTYDYYHFMHTGKLIKLDTTKKTRV